jgi:Domain of unknown function (DUF1772)
METILFLTLILSTALLLGNEFSVAAFVHPALSGHDQKRFLPVIQLFAALFGMIMPFWMAATLVVHVALVFLSWSWPDLHTVLLLLASVLWVLIIVFSLVGPVPINNRVKTWNVAQLPDDWIEQRKRWDLLNAIRVVLIAIAFLLLVVAFKVYQ